MSSAREKGLEMAESPALWIWPIRFSMDRMAAKGAVRIMQSHSLLLS